MTNDERFQALLRLGQADVAKVSMDDLDRLRSEMREEMKDPNHWPGLKIIKSLAKSTAKEKSPWEASVASAVHQQYWEWTRETYAEWKMIEDDDFWTAVHKAKVPPSRTGRH